MGKFQAQWYIQGYSLSQLCHSWGIGLISAYCMWTFLKGEDDHKQPHIPREKREVFVSRVHMRNPSLGF